MDGEDVMEVKVYNERKKHWKRDRKRWKRDQKIEKETEGRTLGEESEQYHFLYKPSLLGSICVESDTHLLLNTNLMLPYNYPRAELIVVILSLLLQILLIWVRFEGHNPLL